jgi:hypothetical protein
MKLSKKVKSWLIILACIELVFWFTSHSIFGIIHTDGPYFGRVVDAKDGKPIAGAAVANVWDLENLILIQSLTTFGGVVEAVTDAEGKYYLPRVWTFSFWPLSWLSTPRLLVFKAGYDSHPPVFQMGWTDEDEKREGMTRHEYQVKYWIAYGQNCERNKECLVQLNAAKNDKERRAARGDLRLGFIPDSKRKKIKNFIDQVNRERIIDGAKPIDY